jgi:hypothetical protein
LAYKDLIEEGYAVYDEGVKISENNENEIRSIGRGGRGGKPNALSGSVSCFCHHKVVVAVVAVGSSSSSCAYDREGAGGGGGGGGATNLQLIVGGRVLIDEGGVIDARGGYGGQGGNGEGGSFFDDHAAPGGGGGGGSGSAVHIAALKGVINKARIIGAGGIGGLSGELPGRYSFYMLTDGSVESLSETGLFSTGDIDALRGLVDRIYPLLNDLWIVVPTLGGVPTTEQWAAITNQANGGNHPILFSEAFGGCGADGIFRVDGLFPVLIPADMQPYIGPIVGKNVIIATDNDSWAKSIYLGMEGWSSSSLLENQIRLQYFNTGVPVIDTYSLPSQEFISHQTGNNFGRGEVHTIPTQIYSPYLEDYYSLHPWQQVQAFYFPGLTDSDGDRVKDGLEEHLGTGIDDTDSDDDGLNDGDEVFVYSTDPLDSDTDDDGISDGDEIDAGTDPLVPDNEEICDGIDNDGDGEIDEGFTADWDNDGVLDCIDLDDDGDGLPDVVEDINGNGFVDANETDPLNPDTDSDGYADGCEVGSGHDPLDEDSYLHYTQCLNLPNPEAGALFGHAMEEVGDVDGGGTADILVSAPLKTVQGIRTGQVYLFSGEDGSIIHVFDNPNAVIGDEAQFGYALSGIVDVTGDWVPDILIGAPFQDKGGHIDVGDVYLFSGSDGALLSRFSQGSTLVDNMHFGISLDGPRAYFWHTFISPIHLYCIASKTASARVYGWLSAR